ncbi:MAG TPA: ABC transporter ATP-binding protein [bacterium]|nr:ABC transporter ATP-binding protein [bacterium]
MSIKVQNLKKRFNGFQAVDDVSFQVADGAFVTLLGPSGSGKSTILRCIAGLEEAGSGSIEINGQDVTHVPVQERQIGFVFQHYALFRHMSILDNVAFGPRVRGAGKKERHEKARELLHLVGLSGMENRRPSQLSGGQRQRVALARALAPEPQLLLLDEPFGALDARLRKELRAWLRELHDRIRLTSLLVTHDQDEAFELSDRVLVVNQGKIEQEAHPQAIFDRPATAFVASFVGETNHVEGVVEEGTVAWGPFRFKAIHLREGTRASVLFRPSDVYVASRREDGGWPGVIQSVQFLGANVALAIRLEHGSVLNAIVPKGVADQSGFEEGKRVYTHVTRAHVFDRTS